MATYDDMHHELRREIANNGKRRGEAQARRDAAEKYTLDSLRPLY